MRAQRGAKDDNAAFADSAGGGRPMTLDADGWLWVATANHGSVDAVRFAGHQAAMERRAGRGRLAPPTATRPLSDEIDTDLADAIAQLAAQQAALEATLRLTSQTFQLSLFDFL
jgi:hypothetical protein